MKNGFAFLFILILFQSCEKPIKSVVVDNPSDEKITVAFNRTVIVNLNPRQSKTIKLKFGTVAMNVNNQKAEEIYLEEEFDYLINPLKETYYLERIKYFNSDRARKQYLENHSIEESEVEGIEVPGDYIKIENQVLIKKNWELGLDKSKSERLNINAKTNKDYVTVRKIYRKTDLLDEITGGVLKYLEQELDKRK